MSIAYKIEHNAMKHMAFSKCTNTGVWIAYAKCLPAKPQTRQIQSVSAFMVEAGAAATTGGRRLDIVNRCSRPMVPTLPAKRVLLHLSCPLGSVDICKSAFTSLNPLFFQQLARLLHGRTCRASHHMSPRRRGHRSYWRQF